MNLEDLGFNKNLENFRNEQSLASFGIGRVIAEHKASYIVKTENGEFCAEMIGNLRHSATNRSDFPVVGDWVAISEHGNNRAMIQSISPRKTVIERLAVGKYAKKQIIASNIDYALIVQAVDRDFNINRIERYLTICNIAGVKPIIILSKIDLISPSCLADFQNEVRERIKSIQVISISNKTNIGYDELTSMIEKGKTYCLLGSSGVGKSTLLNNISGKELMKTGTISMSTKKGRHITSHRELVVLKMGGILIDNPGMREVGITDSESGMENTFDSIIKLSENCKFRDCTHIHEKNCAVKMAVESGELDRKSYENFLKLEKEKAHFESTTLDRRKKDKNFGKMIKNFKKNKRSKK